MNCVEEKAAATSEQDVSRGTFIVASTLVALVVAGVSVAPTTAALLTLTK